MTPWVSVNHSLIAKSISELHFEEVLFPIQVQENKYELHLKSGVSYSFEGRLSAWNHLWVEPVNLVRSALGTSSNQLSAGQFFIDSSFETQMNELTLPGYLEEMNKTLFSDLQIFLKPKLRVDELSKLSGEEIQKHLSGHPKLLLNKGRMGWGEEDLGKFSPESKKHFQLRWILVHKTLLVGSEIAEVQSDFPVPENFRGIPVHPWQWDHVITQQFQHEIQSGLIVDLGVRGDFYSPQISLRTLCNVSDSTRPDIKLPLSILNTSCIRGLPLPYLEFTPDLSVKLEKLISQDELLFSRGVEVLSEKCAWGVVHPLYSQIKGAPYRFHEQLGAVWRESTSSKIKSDEKAVITASLIYQDHAGQTLLGAFVRESGLTMNEWLRKYTQHVIIPLLHLQTKYGIGLVAHGQNIVLKLTKGTPSGLFLKDFHGDLRLSLEHAEIHRELLSSTADKLTKLPGHHLIHDLITGHFITVLRFVAGTLESSGELTEREFYQVLSSEIALYYKQYPLKNEKIDILAPTFQRVLVNRVRFNIVHWDNPVRPLPLLGSDIKNPLYLGMNQ